MLGMDLEQAERVLRVVEAGAGAVRAAADGDFEAAAHRAGDMAYHAADVLSHGGVSSGAEALTHAVNTVAGTHFADAKEALHSMTDAVGQAVGDAAYDLTHEPTPVAAERGVPHADAPAPAAPPHDAPAPQPGPAHGGPDSGRSDSHNQHPAPHTAAPAPAAPHQTHPATTPPADPAPATPAAPADLGQAVAELEKKVEVFAEARATLDKCEVEVLRATAALERAELAGAEGLPGSTGDVVKLSSLLVTAVEARNQALDRVDAAREGVLSQGADLASAIDEAGADQAPAVEFAGRVLDGAAQVLAADVAGTQAQLDQESAAAGLDEALRGEGGRIDPAEVSRAAAETDRAGEALVTARTEYGDAVTAFRTEVQAFEAEVGESAEQPAPATAPAGITSTAPPADTAPAARVPTQPEGPGSPVQLSPWSGFLDKGDAFALGDKDALVDPGGPDKGDAFALGDKDALVDVGGPDKGDAFAMDKQPLGAGGPGGGGDEDLADLQL